MGRLFTIACVGFLLLTCSAMAATWYVKPDGTGDAPTIQAGVDSAAPGDTVLLASGVFTGNGNINIVVTPKAFRMTSETGDPGDCIIDCEGHLGGLRRGFEFDETTHRPIIYGVTVRNGNAGGTGGAVYCEGSPTFRKCVFESNYSGHSGGAVTCFSGYAFPVFKECLFELNQADMLGGAIYIEGIYLVVTVDSCTFYDNEAGNAGAIYCYMHEAEAFVRNSVFVGNRAGDCGGAIEAVNMLVGVENCTFFANSAPTGSAICDWTGPLGGPLADVRRCIIAYGIGGSGYYIPHVDPYLPPLRCTNICGNQGGDWVDSLIIRLGVDGNISVDPAFCNSEMEPYDLSLCDCSPCLPGNHPDGYDCGLIGALGEGCVCIPTSTQPSTWGTIKALYR
jgi:hypothetical protein